MAKGRHINWGNFFLGVFFIIAAFIAYTNPLSGLMALTVFFGIVAIIKGAFNLVYRRKIENLVGEKLTGLVILGIVDIIFGIILLFNINFGLVALPILFAAWVIVDAIIGLLTANSARIMGKGYYWFRLVMNIIAIIIGIMLLFNPVVAALSLAFLVGFYFMLAGIVNIIEAFA